MSTKITQLEKKINENPNNVWANVHNVATEMLIDKVDAAKLRQHGGFNNYLKHLFSQGISEVQIDPRKKNGSSSRQCGLSFNLKLGNNPTEQASQIPQANQTQATNNYPSANQFGLMGGQQVGLGQLLQGQSAIDALARVERDFSELKMKYEALLAEKERIKDEKQDLQNKHDRLEDKLDRKGPLDGIDINQALPALLGLLKPQAGAGLNAPAIQLSPIKEAVQGTVIDPQTPDEITEKAYLLFHYYSTKNENFINQFENLLKTTNQQQQQQQNG